mmetsp:Transcript_11401/g.41722  ORF Transcript_11401/g.41722 Transcript_11401/m.41722 type:complete len:117 (+) Transcript_11401:133-483(+)
MTFAPIRHPGLQAPVQAPPQLPRTRRHRGEANDVQAEAKAAPEVVPASTSNLTGGGSMRGAGARVASGMSNKSARSGKGSYGSGEAAVVRGNARSAAGAATGRGQSRISGKGSQKP